MKLIIESGSTKADWLFYEKSEKHRSTTAGINPTTNPNLDSIDIAAQKDLLIECSHIYLYTAGGHNANARSRVKQWLESKAMHAQVHVYEDTLAAARACFGSKNGVVGILGTGSNSTYYDGAKLHALVPTLGYLTSDEGGGTQLGRKVLQAYYYNQMPEQVRAYYEEHYPTDRQEVVTQLYSKGHNNRYIASFASLLTDIASDWGQALVRSAFEEYIDLRVAPFTKQYQCGLSVIGSIAYYHKEILHQVCADKDISLQEIIHKPLDRLLHYHLEQNI